MMRPSTTKPAAGFFLPVGGSQPAQAVAGARSVRLQELKRPLRVALLQVGGVLFGKHNEREHKADMSPARFGMLGVRHTMMLETMRSRCETQLGNAIAPERSQRPP